MDGWMDGWMDMDKKTTIIFNFLIIFAIANNARSHKCWKSKKKIPHMQRFLVRIMHRICELAYSVYSTYAKSALQPYSMHFLDILLTLSLDQRDGRHWQLRTPSWLIEVQGFPKKATVSQIWKIFLSFSVMNREVNLSEKVSTCNI